MHLTDPVPVDASNAPREAYDIASVIQSTINSSELAQLRYGKVPPAEFHEWWTTSLTRNIGIEASQPSILAAASDGLGDNVERVEHLVVRDLDLPREPRQADSDAGTIVAHAEFYFLPSDWVSRLMDDMFKRFAGGPARPASANGELMDHFESRVSEKFSKHLDGKACYCLKELSTLTSHVRKGIASKLVRWIFPYADEKGVPVYLAASPMGLPVYKKLGFVEVGGEDGAVILDRGKWGGSGEHVHTVVVRYPAGRSS